MNDRRIVIVTGGSIDAWALDWIQPTDYLIGADAGALFLVRYGFRPDVSLGDFDSITAEELTLVKQASTETHVYDPIDKDYTDTELAWRYAVDKCPGEIVMLGALGTRFDHTLANVHLLRFAQQQGIPARLVDEHNSIQLAANRLLLQGEGYTYVSLLPLTETVTGITLRGFQYPLLNATIEIGQSIGISNKLMEPNGEIVVRSGLLLVIMSRD